MNLQFLGNHRKAGLLSGPLACGAIVILVGCTSSTNSVPTPAPQQAGISRPHFEFPAGVAASSAHGRMLAELARIARSDQDDLELIVERQMHEFQQSLAQLPDTATLVERIRLETDIGQAQLKLDRAEDAIETLTAADERAKQADPPVPRGERTRVQFQLALAYLRLGETQNCCQRNTAESCIIPIRGEGLHTKQRGSTEAVRVLMEILAREPDGSPHRLVAIWLLNIAHMTLGTFPDQVPPSYRLPAAALRSTEDFPKFLNVAPDLGLNTVDLAGGAIVEDFDGDGWLDILTSTMDTNGPMHFFSNNQDGTFSERTAEAGLSGLLGGLNMVHADFDNDGDFDVLVLRGGWRGIQGRHPNSLLQNQGDGSFTDVTFDAGLAAPAFPTQTAGWADFDLDGDLDLYIGNERAQGVSLELDVDCPGQLFRNDGDGAFTDIAGDAGVLNLGYAKGVAWGDYDGDRLPDLYVSNLNSENRLYHNLGQGRFEDVTRRAGVTRPVASFPCWFWDFNNDGSLDLMVHSYAANTQHVAAAYLGFSPNCELPCLYQGDGHGTFVDVAASMGIARPDMVMGSNFGDLDNDGWLDCYLGTGRPNYDALTPNVMYHNQAGRGFSDVSTAGGFAHLQKGHGVAFADLDHDGDQDVFEQMGGAFPGDKFGDVLYENPGFGNHWIVVETIGIQSNRAGLAARIHAQVTEDGQQRSIYKHVNTGGSFGCNPYRQMIGLGRATRVDRLEILWPMTGESQTFERLKVDQVVRVYEGSTEPILRKPVPTKFGGEAQPEL